jgi:exosortase family protein XrtF
MTSLRDTITEFRPTIFFLLKFFGLYLVGNLVYGAYVTDWAPRPDAMTTWVTQQSADVLNLFGWEVEAYEHESKPNTFIATEIKPIISVYEGCNGLNVVVVFLAFLLAFGPYKKTMLWFIPLGLVVIHVSNIARIVLLAMVSEYLPGFLYFTHKYLFTAFIYLFVFLLWIWWVMKLAKPAPPVQPAQPSATHDATNA